MEIVHLPLLLDMFHILITYLLIIQLLYTSYKELCDSEVGVTCADDCLLFLKYAIQVQEKMGLLRKQSCYVYVFMKTAAPH